MKVGTVAAVAMAAFALAAMHTPRPAEFTFDPQPRWQSEPGTGELCRAIAAECPGRFADGTIEASWSYAEIYNADGYMVGLRSLKSTGCRALDDHMMLSHRAFRRAFSKGDKPDLDGITIETAAGASRESVRLVKADDTQISMGCS